MKHIYSREEQSWLRKRPPTCTCSKAMLFSNKGFFFCPSCGREVKYLAAGAKLNGANNMDLHRVTITKPFGGIYQS